MKKYQVVNPIRHGVQKESKEASLAAIKTYQPDDMIDLDDEHAVPLLASGDISGPVETKTAKAK